jgi:hypothetical protein
MNRISQPMEAASWDIWPCNVCGAPILFLVDEADDYLAEIHLDRNSLEDLTAILIDLIEDADESDTPESAILH